MPSERDDQAALRETLGALDMPPAALARWLAQNRAFCERHGGRRVYGELLSLFAECEALLAEGGPAEPGGRGGER